MTDTHDVLTRFSRDMGGSMEPDENGSGARMKHSDVEELARKANLAQMNNAPEGVFIVDAQALSLFAALVLEKAITKLRKDLFEASNAPTQPAAGADVLDGKRWRYAIADGGNQSMNFLDIYDDWDGDGAFVDAFDKAMNSDAAIAASGRKP